MNDFVSQDERRIREERERKKAEVRARLEAQSSSKNQKKGFMTPDRKKKLRNLLRQKAAEELKRQQEVKANERKRIISERTGERKNFEAMSEGELKALCQKMHERLLNLESQKWDMESQVGRKELEIHKLSTQVSDMRGKFAKPPLKRIPKFQAKIEKMLLNARKEVGFTVTLKSVKKDQFKVEENKDNNKDQPPEWHWKKGQAAGGAGGDEDEEEEAAE